MRGFLYVRGFLFRVWLFLVGVFFIAPSAIALIAIVAVVKFFHKKGLQNVSAGLTYNHSLSDPFHNSRQHPLNDPGAPRG